MTDLRSDDDLIEIGCVTDKIAESLYDAGIENCGDIATMSQEHLEQIDGINSALAGRMKVETKEIGVDEKSMNDDSTTSVNSGTTDSGRVSSDVSVNEDANGPRSEKDGSSMPSEQGRAEQSINEINSEYYEWAMGLFVASVVTITLQVFFSIVYFTTPLAIMTVSIVVMYLDLSQLPSPLRGHSRWRWVILSLLIYWIGFPLYIYSRHNDSTNASIKDFSF